MRAWHSAMAEEAVAEEAALERLARCLNTCRHPKLRV